jgi:hypothetical protein
MPPQALAALATLVSFAAHGNRIELTLDRGSAELEWVTGSTFHFRRTLEGPLPQLKVESSVPVAFDMDDTPGGLRVRSKFVEVTIPKRGVLLRVRKPDGTTLLSDATEPRPEGGGFTWERLSGTARYYGLGPRADLTFDLKRTKQTVASPLLFSTAGYGEFHPGTGKYEFDFAAAGRYRIHAPAIDFYFYYGPTAKQVFEEHKTVRGPSELWPAAAERTASWGNLRDTMLRLVQGAMSAKITPVMDLGLYAKAPEELLRRARQVGSLVLEVTPGAAGLSDFRKKLESFFQVYETEIEDKGFPVWHPLPFQFPEDPECARHADEFLLGDEMLIAPIYEPGGKRQVYLPQGVWTDLETNLVYQGRQTISVTTESLPVFARNGTILPLDAEGGMELHYFPKLGAEFFLLETDAQAWTQVHASPAVDVMRLQIESKKDRDYVWVVHHVDRPSAVGFDEVRFREASAAGLMADRTWFYDAARKNVHIRVRLAAGADSIINLEN